MCYVYNKSISIQSFSRLTGINQDTIFDWGKNINKLSSSGCEIYKKLSIERESAWVAKLESMNHPTAIAILLNKQYGYNLPGVSREQATLLCVLVSSTVSTSVLRLITSALPTC